MANRCQARCACAAAARCTARYWGASEQVPGLHFETCATGASILPAADLGSPTRGASTNSVAGFLPTIVRSRHHHRRSALHRRLARLVPGRTPRRARIRGDAGLALAVQSGGMGLRLPDAPTRPRRSRRRAPRCADPTDCWRWAATSPVNACSMPMRTGSSGFSDNQPILWSPGPAHRVPRNDGVHLSARMRRRFRPSDGASSPTAISAR